MLVNIKLGRLLLLVAGTAAFAGCSKWYSLPPDADYLSENINYTTLRFEPILGRTTVMGNFTADNSNLPLKFEIINPRNKDGSPAAAFSQVLPIKAWTLPYTGLEKSLAEIEDKRKPEDHPLFEVLKSGEFTLWSTAVNSNFLKTGVDSTYTFDVRVSNSGGTRTIKDIVLSPVRERPYEPSFHINQYSGVPLYEATGVPKRLLPNILSGMRGQATNKTLVREEDANTVKVRQDCWVYFNRKGDGNRLTFKFMDKDSAIIKPSRFNGTKWESLIHGFDMEMTDEYVRYKVAYPIPLNRVTTVYTTSDGLQASVNFLYNRIGFSGARETGQLGLSFNIFQEGDWEVIFFFHNETPRFDNE